MRKVPSGYKMTEVGVIPEDWECLESCAVVTYFGGNAFKGEAAVSNGVRWLKIANVGIQRTQWAEATYLPYSYTTDFSDYLLKQGDVVMALTRPILGNELKIAKLTSLDIPCLLNQRVGKVITHSQADLDFIYYVLQTRHFVNSMNEAMAGTDPPNIGSKALGKISIALPSSKAEQRAIATALAEVDSLLAKLDQLIAKKRDFKQAAMQQLLSGQTRLPGFSGPWEVKRLGDVLEYEQPTKYLVKDSEYSDDNDVPVLTAGKTFILGYTNEQNGIFNNLPAIIFDDFTTANKYVTFPFKAKSSAMKILSPRDATVNLRLLFEVMQLINFQLGDHKRYWISEYQNLEIQIPDAKEQTAIATVLSDLDAELASLEARRNKTRALKQGMMQELLTGRIRLVSPGGAEN